MNSFKARRNLLWKTLESHFSTVMLMAMSITIFIFNRVFFHYHGNQYIPSIAFRFTLYMVFFYMFTYGLPALTPWRSYFKDGLGLGLCVLSISFATNAVQLTPFQTIDHLLGRLEFLPLTTIIHWTKASSPLFAFLTQIYNSLNSMLIIVPILLIVFQKKIKLNAFYQFIMMSTIIGFFIYFFFPSCGPASFFPKEFFEYYQLDNDLKFQQIHQGLHPTTELGGLIAFPSFHVIWAYACVYPLDKHTWIQSLMYLWFILICISCVMLGWHYSWDIMGSLFIIGLTRKIIS